METFLLIVLIGMLVAIYLVSSARWHSTMTAIASLRPPPRAETTAYALPTAPSNDELVKLSRSIADSLAAIERSILLHRTEIESDVAGIGRSIDRVISHLDTVKCEVRELLDGVSDGLRETTSTSRAQMREVASELRSISDTLSREFIGLEAAVRPSADRHAELTRRFDSVDRILDRLDPGESWDLYDGP